ncbi:MAG: hypothetical protein IPO08_22815 [Xanthomonadales bacterium]|nr:hypothetical protein [Xanthomonadales bacterium]
MSKPAAKSIKSPRKAIVPRFQTNRYSVSDRKITLPDETVAEMNSRGIAFKAGGQGSTYIAYALQLQLALTGNSDSKLREAAVIWGNMALQNKWPLLRNLKTLVDLLQQLERIEAENTSAVASGR